MGQMIPHAERSGWFCLSPGEVKSQSLEAGDGHKYICLDALTFALGSYLAYGGRCVTNTSSDDDGPRD